MSNISASGYLQRMRELLNSEDARELTQDFVSSNSPDVFDALIEIVNGQVRHRPMVVQKRLLMFKVLVPEGPGEYSLEAQLAAVEALGELGGKEALQFIRGLAVCQEQEEYLGGLRNDPYAWYDTMSIHYEFPNARGRLKKALDYSVYVSHQYEDLRGFDLHTHQIVDSALFRLTTDRLESYSPGTTARQFFWDGWNPIDPYHGRVGIIKLYQSCGSVEVTLGRFERVTTRLNPSLLYPPRLFEIIQTTRHRFDSFISTFDESPGDDCKSDIILDAVGPFGIGAMPETICIMTFENNLLVSVERISADPTIP